MIIIKAYFCSQCGRELKTKDSCCGYCGTWHGYSSSMRNKAISECSNCKRDLESGRICCSYCGTWYKDMKKY